MVCAMRKLFMCAFMIVTTSCLADQDPYESVAVGQSEGPADGSSLCRDVGTSRCCEGIDGAITCDQTNDLTRQMEWPINHIPDSTGKEWRGFPGALLRDCNTVYGPTTGRPWTVGPGAWCSETENNDGVHCTKYIDRCIGEFIPVTNTTVSLAVQESWAMNRPPAGKTVVGIPSNRGCGTQTNWECIQQYGPVSTNPNTVGCMNWCIRTNNNNGVNCIESGHRCYGAF